MSLGKKGLPGGGGVCGEQTVASHHGGRGQPQKRKMRQWHTTKCVCVCGRDEQKQCASHFYCSKTDQETWWEFEIMGIRGGGYAREDARWPTHTGIVIWMTQERLIE